jgi:hypothetical protein
MEEWDFSRMTGSTLVHIETAELLAAAESIPEAQIGDVVNQLKSCGDLDVMLDESKLAFCTRIYLAINKLREDYGLSYCAAQCYPNNGGICNLASCLLADEGFVLDTEGDIGHAALMYAYSAFGGTPACLSETGGLEPQFMYLEHEGSSALSLKPEGFKATLRECGDGGMVGFTLRPMKQATIASIGVADGGFAIFTSEGMTSPVDTADWERLEGRFLGAFCPQAISPKEWYARLVHLGADHHFVLKEGNYTACFKALCGMMGIRHVTV